MPEESKLVQKLESEEVKASEVKFDENELQKLQELQNSYQDTILKFGQLKVQRTLLQQQLDGLDTAEEGLEKGYAEIQSNEAKIVQDLNEKYGPGSLDPATGVFTPSE
jgi:hypothetical protein|tara:strand:+ start:245 stop:568 length:324 start_codon:yes stop_codon:yes gene_type:complete